MGFLILPLAAAGAAAAGTAGGAATIGGVAGLIGITSTTTAAIVNAGVGTALVLGASYAVAKLSPTPRQPRPADGTVEYKAPLAPRFFPYGRCKVSGPVLLLELNDLDPGTDNVRLLKIVAFGTRELAFMDPFYIDGTRITLDAGVSGSDGSYVNWSYGGGSHGGGVRTYLGSDSQAADALIMSYASYWTTDHRLRGIPYAASEFDSVEAARFQEAFPNGESNFATVGGVKLYDPRLDSTNGGAGSHRMTDPTTWAFSENQRLAALDWITWKDGYAKDWARIDWASWVPQIAMADEDVPLKSGATEKRYRIATVVTLTEPKGRVLRRIMDAGDQQLYTTSAGLIGSRGGVWQTPSASLSAAEILEAQFTHGVGMMDRTNEFQLTAMLPSHDYAEVELAPWSNTSDPEFIDGILRSQPLDLTQVPSNSQAQRLAKIRMAKVNPRWSGSVRTNFAGLDALGEAAVNLSFDELDQPDGTFDGPFLVNGKIGFLPDRTGMTVSLSSIDPTCYDWSSAEEHDAPPLPDAPAMTVTPVVSGSLVTGSVLSCTTGTWTGATSYAYQWKRGAVGIVGATSSTYTLVIADVGALISCAVTATNAAGSAYALSNTVGPVTGAIPINTVLPVISGTPAVGSTLTTTTGTWTNSPTSYAYQWKKGGVNISGATASTYVPVSGDVGGTITVTVTATNASGSASATAAGVGPVYVPIALSAVSAPDFCDIFVWGRATTDTGSGSLYAVACLAAAAAPSAVQIVAGTDAAGAAAPNANVAISSTGVKNLLLRGLTATTAYTIYFAQQSGSVLSNVVNASFTTDTLVIAFATNGTAGAGMGPSTGSAAFGTNQADPYGGTNAIRWVDNNDAVTNAQVAASCAATFFNGVNKIHITVKYQSGAALMRLNTGSITIINLTTYWNTSTGAMGTTNAAWTPTPVVWDVGSGWKMFSGQINLAGADVAGALIINKAAVDNSIVGITHNGTHIQDLYNIRITRV